MLCIDPLSILQIIDNQLIIHKKLLPTSNFLLNISRRIAFKIR